MRALLADEKYSEMNQMISLWKLICQNQRPFIRAHICFKTQQRIILNMYSGCTSVQHVASEAPPLCAVIKLMARPQDVRAVMAVGVAKLRYSEIKRLCTLQIRHSLCK